MTSHIESRIAHLGRLCESARALAERHESAPRVAAYWQYTAAEYSARAFELASLL